VATAPYGDLQIVIAGETHGRNDVSGPEASGDQARATVDGAVPDRTGDVVVGVAGIDETPSEPVDLCGRILPVIGDVRGCRYRHNVLRAPVKPARCSE
jgi:hypothetical protein